MTGTSGSCEAVQLQFVRGDPDEAARAHADTCSECGFFRTLSSVVRPAAAASGADDALEAALQESLASGVPLLGRWRLLKALGHGGEGRVYQAEDLLEPGSRPVALKLLRLEPGAASEASRARDIQHPNVCRVFHSEQHGSIRLVVMEWLPGGTLADRLGRLPLREAVACFLKLCEGVAAAHRAGIWHLDLKPQNVLLREDGSPVIADFGLALRAGAGPASAPGGTPQYMAPEQRTGGVVDGRADVYALGKMLGDLLGGDPARYARVIARAMRDAPAERHPDVPSLARAVRRVGQGRRWAWVAFAGALTLVGAAWARETVAAARRPSGVLVLGGTNAGGVYQDTAEWFDTRSARFRPLPRLPDDLTCRTSAFWLADGQVLLAGGGAATGCHDDGTTTQRTLLFDPARQLWSAPSCQRPCTTLPDGGTSFLDAATRTWREGFCLAEGPCLAYGRSTATALTLNDGSPFLLAGCAGGCNGPNALEQTDWRGTSDGGSEPGALPRTAEIFDAHRGAWRLTPESKAPHVNGSAVQLGGFVLVCGGNDGINTWNDVCERYDVNSTFDGQAPWTIAEPLPRAGPPPRLVRGENDEVLAIWTDEWRRMQSGKWGPAQPLPTAQPAAVLTALPGGRLLLTGGASGEGESLASAALYDPARPLEKRWTSLPPMSTPRFGHVAEALGDGRVLVAGGCGNAPLDSAEVLDLATSAWTDVGSMTTPRCAPLAVPLGRRE